MTTVAMPMTMPMEMILAAQEAPASSNATDREGLGALASVL